MVALTRRKHVVYIILTGILSVVSLAIVSTSAGAEDWIRAVAEPKITSGPLHSNINYGLFKGTLLRRPVYSPYEYDLYFTCIWKKNACAWSCIDDADARKEEVEYLVNGNKTRWACIPRRTEANFATRRARISEEMNEDMVFTNGGLWLSTIIFMAILTVALFASVVLSITNCVTSPIETYLNVRGIYITNGIALVTNFLVLLLYGTCYSAYIKEDIAIFDTIVGDYTSEAQLGYCYWMLYVPLAFEGVGIFVIAMREKIVNSDRAEMKIDMSTDIPETGVLF